MNTLAIPNIRYIRFSPNYDTCVYTQRIYIASTLYKGIAQTLNLNLALWILLHAVSYDDGHRVEYVSTNAVFDSESSVTLSWSPTSVAPFLDPNSYTVDINLHCLDEDTYKWTMVSTLTANIPNTGHALVTLPDSAGDRKACAMVIQVVVNGATSTDTHSKRAISGLVKTALKFGLWTAVVYYVVIKPALTHLCVVWSGTQHRGLAKQLKGAVEPCPPTMAQALADRRFDKEYKVISDFFHTGSASCFRQVIINT